MFFNDFGLPGPLGSALERLLSRLGALLDRLETILGRLGLSWIALGPSWSSIGPLLGCLGRLLAVLDVSWAVLGASWDRPGVLHLIPSASPSPWTPSSKGFAPNKRHHSFLALSVTWDGTQRKERFKESSELCTSFVRFRALAFSILYEYMHIQYMNI